MFIFSQYNVIQFIMFYYILMFCHDFYKKSRQNKILFFLLSPTNFQFGAINIQPLRGLFVK